MIRRPPRSTLSSSSAASDVYKRQGSQRPRPVAQQLGAGVAGLLRVELGGRQRGARTAGGEGFAVLAGADQRVGDAPGGVGVYEVEPLVRVEAGQKPAVRAD